MCSPSWFHQRHGSDQTYDLSIYENDGMRRGRFFNFLSTGWLCYYFFGLDEYFDDLGQAYRTEIKELYYFGCRKHLHIDDTLSPWNRSVGHIQIDDPTFCFFCNEKMIAQMEAAGVDHEALLDTYIRAINICTAERPNDLTISVHMCRGNFKVRDVFLLPGFFLTSIVLTLADIGVGWSALHRGKLWTYCRKIV